VDAGHALGALAATLPTLVMRATAVGPDLAHRATFAACAVAMLACIVPYLALSSTIEADSGSRSSRARAPVDPRSRRVITRLALLFGLDSIGGGFLNSALIAYWFFLQYGTSEADLALLFFAARVLNALSHLGVRRGWPAASGF
jgi:hypothetical protein